MVPPHANFKRGKRRNFSISAVRKRGEGSIVASHYSPELKKGESGGEALSTLSPQKVGEKKIEEEEKEEEGLKGRQPTRQEEERG